MTVALAERAGACRDLVHERAGLERLEVARRALEAREREQLVEQAGHPQRLRLDHAQRLGGVRFAQRRCGRSSSTLPRTIATGVRSSWLASATNRRWSW